MQEQPRLTPAPHPIVGSFYRLHGGTRCKCLAIAEVRGEEYVLYQYDRDTVTTRTRAMNVAAFHRTFSGRFEETTGALRFGAAA